MRPKTSDNFLLHKLSVHDDGSENTPNQNWNLTQPQPARGEALITRRVQFQRYTLVPLLSKVKDIWVAGFSAQLARLLSRSWFIPVPKTVFGSISSFSIFHPKEHREQPPIDCDDQGRVSHLWSGHDWQLQSRFREISIKCTSSHSAHRQHIEDSRRENAEARRHLFRASFTPNAPPNPQEERASSYTPSPQK